MDFAVGQILLTALDFAPSGTLACNGRLVPLSTYPGLFDALGTRYGGDGQSAFALPDISPIATADGQPLSWAIVAEGPGWGNGTYALFGEVRLLPGPPPSQGGLASQWTPCDGRTLSTGEFPVLAALLGTQFGGDGTSTFGLPTLAPAAATNGPALGYYICTGTALYPPTGGDNSADPAPETYTFDTYLGSVLPLPYLGNVTRTIESLALCLGQTLPIDAWTQLYSLIGARFGADGTTRFRLPSLPTGADGIVYMMVMNGYYPARS